MYESPITVLYNEMITKVNESVDNGILEAVTKVGINVDRDELIKAISYDRGQYEKGFSDGLEEGKPKWISVKDRLPEEGQSVLIHYVDGWMPVAHLFNGKWYASGGETSWLSVTHWMPLPEPPKEE